MIWITTGKNVWENRLGKIIGMNVGKMTGYNEKNV